MVTVCPSCAVQAIVTVVVPTETEIALLVEPDATDWPFTRIVAVVSVSVGVNEIDETVVTTDTL